MKATPDSLRAALDQEITATLDTLAHLLGANQAENGGEEGDPHLLSQLIERFGRTGFVACELGLPAVHDVCALFQAGLEDIADGGLPLKPGVLDLLLEWPQRVTDYLDATQDSSRGRALVGLLSRPEWVQPITEEEAAVLVELLVTAAVDSPPCYKDGVSIGGLVNSLDRDTLFEAHDAAPRLGEAVESARGSPCSEDRQSACDVPEAPLQLATDFFPKQMATTVERAFVAEGQRQEGSGQAEQDASRTEEEEGLDEALAGRPPVPSNVLAVQFASADGDDACRGTAPREEVDTAHPVFAKPVRRELISLLEVEVRDIGPTFTQVATATSNEERSMLFESLAETIGRMAEAAEALGMPGFAQVCVQTASNLTILAKDAEADKPAILEAWPGRALAYLEVPDDLERCRELVEYLQGPEWPAILPDGVATGLAERLYTVTSDTTPEPRDQRQTRATDADISLAVPGDVNPELLESLLLELPALTAQFSAAINRLNTDDRELEDLRDAQRAAHTLKGASNTVGVSGIATLAHHLEDILQALAKHGQFPTGSFAECLTDASDCLEIMAEYLLGMGEAPSRAKAVLQQVLDWANWIDHNGLPTGQECLSNTPQQTNPPDELTSGEMAEAATEPAPPVTSGVPHPLETKNAGRPIAAASATISLADELLRLSGELNILHGQLTNRLDRAIKAVSAWQTHGNLLQQLAIELEQLVDIRGISWVKSKGAVNDEFDPLEMDQYNELHTLCRRLMEAASDAQELGKEVTGQFDGMKALFVAQSRLQRDNEETVLRTRMVPAQTVVPRLQRSVRQTCRASSKQAELKVVGADTLIDNEVLNELVDPLMHVLRNAVDHGIESPADRPSCNKPPTGVITLEFGRSGNHVRVRCSDDGAGLDLKAIQRKAEQQDLIQWGRTLTDEELAQLILKPGLSTRDTTSQISGRGIGMDAVYHCVQKLNGSLQLFSTPGAGLSVELLLPASLLSTHGLLIRIGAQLMAISSRGVTQILPPEAGELGRLGDIPTYTIGQDVYEAIHLETLLQVETDIREDVPRPVLLVRDSAGSVRAVLVEAVLESQTLVVKSISDYVPALDGIMGATILGDGSVAPVVDLEALLRKSFVERSESSYPPIDGSRSTASRPLRALVVDDSLSARRSMTQLLKDAGFEVDVALDGLEAVAAMGKELPDVLVVDMEMPRMNGLELTRHVRSNASTQHLPVIMVTSRSTDRHRRQAEAAGVTAYVNKPYAEDELLNIVSDFTALRGAA